MAFDCSLIAMYANHWNCGHQILKKKIVASATAVASDANLVRHVQPSTWR